MQVKRFMLLLTVLVVLAMAGCNAVKGLGKDIHDGAAVVQDVIDHEVSYSREW